MWYAQGGHVKNFGVSFGDAKGIRAYLNCLVRRRLVVRPLTVCGGTDGKSKNCFFASKFGWKPNLLALFFQITVGVREVCQSYLP